MNERGESYRWAVIFSQGVRSELHEGSQATRDAALHAMLDQARAVRAARETDLMPYCTLEIGTTPAEMYSTWVPMSDLSLDDDTLIARIDAEEATRREQARQREARSGSGSTGTDRAAYATRASSVEAQWTRVRNQVSQLVHEPSEVSAAASTAHADIRAATEIDTFAWTAELTDLFTLVHSSQRLTPYGPLYSVEEMVDTRAALLANRDQAESGEGDLFERGTSENQPAGTPAFTYLDGFVPIAGDDRDYLVVDLRAGALHGCVSVCSAEGDSPGALWVSISAMLSDLADSIAGRAVFNGIWVAEAVGTSLSWDAP